MLDYLQSMMLQKADMRKEANFKNDFNKEVTFKNNALKSTSLNLTDLILNGNQIQNPYLFDGDIIEVKKQNIRM